MSKGKIKAKRYEFETLFEGNPLVLLCVFFTFSMVILVVLDLITGNQSQFTTRLFIESIVFNSAPVLPLAIGKFLVKHNYISQEKYHFWTGLPMHYIISTVLMVLFVAVIFPSALLIVYVSAVLNFTINYSIIVLIAIIIFNLQTRAANQHLKKIQKFQKGD